MKKKIIIFTEEEIRKLKLKRKDGYYIINRNKIVNKKSNKKCNE